VFASLAAAFLAATPPAGACALVPPETIASAQGAKFVSSKESETKGSAVERRDCFYQTDPFVDSVSFEWNTDAIPGGARRRWNALFHEQDPGEKDEDRERPKALPARVAGLGEEAFWIPQPHGGALYVLAGEDGFLRVSVGGAASSEEKRERSRRIAAAALRSLRGDPKAAPPAADASKHDLR
jgi:hypothetical protein